MATPNEPIERDAETLALYIEESLEGLQQIDQLLLEAERGAPRPELMATLFRAVHTMKGTAGYLAFERTQALSHTAEDLLSRLRDKKLAARPEHFSHLMEVGDRLRAMVENVRQTGEEGEVDVASLVERLRQSMTSDGVTAGASELASTCVDKPAAAAQPAAAAATPASSAKELVEDGPRAALVVSPGKADANDGTVRVAVAVLDRLMNLIGELVLARNQMVQVVKVAGDLSVGSQPVFQRLNVVTTELQEQVMKTRMQPVSRVFEKIPRMVRDVARVVGKEVVCEIEGNSTEIDKALVEAIRDPVMHIVRNAIDHGIESAEDRKKSSKAAHGTLYVRAAHKGGAVTIEIEDDGKGMDPAFLRAHAVKKGVITRAESERLGDRESLDLVFRAGFSTAAQVSDISGRGVGMDVVRTHVEQAGGHAEIESVLGQGTTVRLKMPLTLAIIPALLVRANSQRFAIPQVNIVELVYLTQTQALAAIEWVRGVAIHKLRGEIIPVVDLRTTLGVPAASLQTEETGTYCVVVASGARRYSLILDGIDNTEEVVIKPLRGQLKRLSCYSGATVLGDGGVALILDVAGIAAKAGIDLSSQRRNEVASDATSRSTHQQMMIFRTGGGVQCAVPVSMVARLEQVQAADIEVVAQMEVLQYRGQLLPIVRPEASLSMTRSAVSKCTQLLVVFDFGQLVAMAVDDVVDVVDLDVETISSHYAGAFINGKAVVFGQTTLLLDVFALMRSLAPHFLRPHRKTQALKKVVVVDRSEALRSSLTRFLQETGIIAVGVSSVEAACRELRAEQATGAQAVVVDADEILAQGAEAVRLLRGDSKQLVNVVAWTVRDGDDLSRRLTVAGVPHCFHKLEREQILSALQTMAAGGAEQVAQAERKAG